jgi:hypothetical protein
MTLSTVPDELDDDERERLHRALEQGLAEVDAGKALGAADVLARLRAR